MFPQVTGQRISAMPSSICNAFGSSWGFPDNPPLLSFLLKFHFHCFTSQFHSASLFSFKCMSGVLTGPLPTWMSLEPLHLKWDLLGPLWWDTFIWSVPFGSFLPLPLLYLSLSLPPSISPFFFLLEVIIPDIAWVELAPPPPAAYIPQSVYLPFVIFPELVRCLRSSWAS